MLEVRLLGGFSLKAGKKELPLPSRPAQSLLAYLILNAETAHRREKLAGQLWPDTRDEAARDYLRHALWRIRKALADGSSLGHLKADDLTVGFDGSRDFWFDCAVVKQASKAEGPDALIQALSAYGGELLPGFYDDWVVLEREHVQAIYEQEMGRLIDLLQGAGRWPEVLDWAEKWISHGQKPEAAYRALMLAHAARGDMVKVAATYDRCRKTLSQFGLEPSEQTTALFEEIKSGSPPAPRSVGPAASVQKPAPTSSIPVPLTSFIGRNRELKEIAALLAESRLVTLTGPGGVGKTRLAIESAQAAHKVFKDDVFWVGLVALNEENLIPQEIAHALSVREVPDEAMIDTIKGQIKNRKQLLILDNCEHLVRGCAAVSEQLLAACPGLTILATSRERLGLFNEVVWPVPSLDQPISVRLFTERARSAQRGFVATGSNASVVQQICQRLEGMPLAIELAAARVSMLSPGEIASRLDKRFALLTGGARTALPRHQTLRSAIDWSHDLLAPSERTLFRRLAVFTGSFALTAAEGVCVQPAPLDGTVLDLLGKLVDKSLVTPESETGTGETRYRLLETIREYALEHLNESGELETIRNAHMRYFQDLVEVAEPVLRSGDQAAWLDRLEADHGNIRAAIDWALASGQTASALLIAGCLWRFWLIRNHDGEGMDRLSTLLARPDTQQASLPRLKALTAYLQMTWTHGGLDGIQAHLSEALRLGQELGDRWQEACARLWAGVEAAEQGTYEVAESLVRQSIDIWTECGDLTYAAQAKGFMGDIALMQGDYSAAGRWFEDAAERFREVKDSVILGLELRRLGQVAAHGGDLGAAEALIADGLLENWKVRDFRGIGACIAALAAVSADRKNLRRAARLYGAVEGLMELTHIPLLPFDQVEFERNVAALRARMPAAALAKAWAEGRNMAVEDAVEFALKDG